MPRIVGAFAAGRIVNPRTARSQLMGGHDLGHRLGAARGDRDRPRAHARYVNDNLAEYLIPVNADIAAGRGDPGPGGGHEVNPVGIKGIGELGNVGTAAAVANAVFHATGKRIRDLPIRIEDLLDV